MIGSPYTDLLPRLSDAEYQALKDDIAERGCLVPVEIDEEGKTLDGAHRLRACGELGIQAPTITRRGLSDEEKRAHAIALNLQRRQLSREQRKELHVELRAAGRSIREIAEASGVPKSTVAEDVEQVSETGHVTGRDGKSYPATKPKPAPVISFPEQPQHEAPITEKEHKRAEKKAARPAPQAAPPIAAAGTFPVLYADPPWRYEHSETPDLRSIENQYPTMPVEDICALEVPAADDAVLFRSPGPRVCSPRSARSMPRSPGRSTRSSYLRPEAGSRTHPGRSPVLRGR